MIAKGTKDFSLMYSSWFGKPVVTLVAIRQCRVPMTCSIWRIPPADVLVRLQPGWEMDIRKNLVLAVEEVGIATQDRLNRFAVQSLDRSVTCAPV